jgi:uridylate kinase, putative
MKVVLSIGGSVLAPELDPGRIGSYAQAVGRMVDAGVEVICVVGGGGAARAYIDSARTLGADEVMLDQLGIAITRLNARLLQAALGDRAAAEIPTGYTAAVAAATQAPVVVMGGAVAGQTTDAVATAVAERYGAELLVIATSVDGVYDLDPQTNPDAEKFETIEVAELVELIVPMSRGAGSSAPVDLVAVKLLERTGMRAIVLDGTDPAAVAAAVLDGEHTGTEIIAAGSDA